ncbi:MAG: tripartite tricarboxylate transporter substrate binding protein [Betaproteobacteria bacterium]|nr:tripartite tricarboxylate transporter substrate binding protein [Betaproteobacteria bacterium]PWB67071.1 MAG: C4-dicarboxylate ABC transporter substrate-binding protein [Betaproteobacteria bacterium]
MARLSPRNLLRATALAAGLAIAGSAVAFDSVRMMIPANPGGGWDTTGRELGKAMIAAGAVKNIQYDNKGGAAGAIGLAQFVSASKGDPNALMMGGMVMVGGLIQNKSAVTIDQVTPIARLTSEYEVIVVPSNSPIKDMKDLMAKFKANPGSISWGGGSAGGTDHILAGLLAKEVGVEPGKVNYVPFKGGGEAVAAIIGGHVSVGVSGLSEFAQHIQSGKMRALAVSSAEKMNNIPSLKEQGFNVELANWRGIFGAPGITKEQQAALVKAVEAATKHASWAETLKKQEWTAYWLPGDQYGAFVQAENKRIGEILAGLSLGKK